MVQSRITYTIEDVADFLKDKFKNEYIASRVTLIHNNRVELTQPDIISSPDITNQINTFSSDLSDLRQANATFSFTNELFNNKNKNNIIEIGNEEKSDEKEKIDEIKKEFKAIDENDENDKLLTLHKKFNDSIKKHKFETVYHYFIHPNSQSNLSYTFILIINKKLNNIELLEILSKVKSNMLLYYYANMQKHAIKSATAAIMARNMSHNLGSHILYYLKTILKNTPKRFEHLLYELERANDGNNTLKILEKYKENIQYIKETDTVQAPFLIGLGKFLGYLQERQDFIATIASNFIPYFDAVNFKDFIFDEILPNKRQDRHNSYKIKNIFLDFIAKSEEYTSEDIEVYFNGFNGNNTEKDKELKETINTIEVNLPGGTLGRQAFFSIFENFLRNTAKHNNKVNPLKIYIKLEDSKYPDFYKISIYDNVTEYEKLKEKITYALEKDDFIDAEGKPSKTNKGIKEMRISAAWLRGLNIAEIDEQNIGIADELEYCENASIGKMIDEQNIGIADETPKLLTIHNENGFLAYVFYLFKTKNTILITTNANSEETENKEIIEKVTVEKYLKIKNKNYNIILIDTNLEDDKKTKIKEVSVPRFIEDTIDNFTKIFNKLNENKAIANHYQQQWIKASFKDSGLNFNSKFITIVDNKDLEVDSKHIAKYNTVEMVDYKTILFNEHNDIKHKFIALKNKHSVYENSLFIEGISGDNSTARLIRNENLDDFWAFKMAESALTKVLILDERLFDFYQANKGASEHQFTKDDFKSCETEDDFKKVIAEYKATYNDELKYFITKKILDNTRVLDNRYGFDKIIELLNQKTFVANYKTELLAKKQLTLAKIEKSTNDNFIILDLNNTEIYPDFYTEISKTTKLAEKNNYNYDFLLIHQGLLDKLFTTLKTKFEQLGDEAIKEIIFSNIQNYFGIRYKTIIHSGRSKPEYLPKKAIFNQFSSVENALFDCKFTLTELLYSSRKQLDNE